MPFKKILVAVDDGPIAAHAVDAAAELAALAGGTLAFVHVIDPELVNAADTGLQPAALEAEVRGQARQLLDAYRQRLSLATPPLEFLPTGGAAHEIAAAAANWPADVVVIGSHGRGGLRRALVGSVAEGVMRHAPCPVLIVRGKD